ncbi:MULTISPECIES: hypothetical protein [Corallococcus]|uniref:hypothetical protein n=1 Tax=Corallococcus TaxID=83461 RepID=UPI0018F64659|nr:MULTISPECIES: hypothetical protein [Corallococcus]
MSDDERNHHHGLQQDPRALATRTDRRELLRWMAFTSSFPACYSGRWPHIHFEIYPSVEATSSSRNKVATSLVVGFKV